MLRLILLFLAALLAACSPPLDWREVRGDKAPFSVLMPAKPSRLTRPVNLDGLQVEMSMTAAEAEGMTFAVGAAPLPDSTQAPHALDAMQRAMLNNIGGTVRQATPERIDATGTANGKPAFLYARFTAKGQWVYQAVVLARDKAAPPEALDTFFQSFQPR